jgi:hypothetical protein
MKSSVSAAHIYQEYQIISSGTATAAQALTFNSETGRQRITVEAVDQRMYIKFGSNAGITASKTLTGNVLAAGNFSIPAGCIREIDVPNPSDYDYVSVMSETGTGTAIIQLCNVARG